MAEPDHILHATTVAWHGRAALILGAPGSGKSALALRLMALGCDLVADDRTNVEPRPEGVVATCPPALRGLIEARGVGILKAAAIDRATVVLAIDLDRSEDARLPVERLMPLCGHQIPLVYQAPGAHFPAAIVQYLKAGRHA